jgi:putative tricarboxylic transport membrane protein
MKAGDLASGLVWLLAGAAAAWVGLGLGLGSVNDPGPGFLLFWIGVIMAALAAILVVGAARGVGEVGPLGALWAGTRWRRVVVVVAGLVVYAFLFERLGFLLSTVLLMVFLFRAVEPAPWWVAVGGAVATAVIAYVVFGRWLGAQLPRGFLG